MNNKINRKMSLLLILIMVLTQIAFAEPVPVSVKINDTYLKTDAEHLLIDGRVYVVARFVAEALGAQVTWDETNAVAHFVKEDMHLVFGQGGGKSLRIDTEIPIEGHTFISEGRLYVPVRVFAEFFLSEVTWISESRTVQITKEDVVIPEELTGEAPIDEKELEWLARMVSVEARDGSVIKKIAVANVILNRVKSDQFPDTVYDVIMQKGQFPPAHWTSFPGIEPDEVSIEAATRALYGENNVETCLYFNLKPFSWKPQSDFYKEIEGDYFYY
ncbi:MULTISPECIES: stalk domain-containing protein [unclassified Fusibacter]|uniref:stalk domain-containing protein n=1 Tax=unclassified Fusibacter TaxID=2624464 RepID=UPI001012B36C|nr:MULTISPECIES: stalk domain-containing protein [unclassified Fusibacter]MCK8060542.1 cell wall hydrolase [Fusibacter sp. A2]NPE23004.1 copper amine oxidase [Fusibacter sp. A1]RXV60069.1 copper amine oxidase [Fusibacter sp. A1]